MRFEAAIASFAAALADPAAPIPHFTLGRSGVPDGKRFAVYRNNVAVGLIGALEARFPVTRRLMGDEFFRAMARAFVFAHKPPTPLIIHYGRDFPGFVEAFAPARDIPYLGEVARLEDAWVEAYHAAEASPLTLNDLASVAPEKLEGLTFVFHPAARLLSFDHPAASIWAAHQGEASPRGPDRMARRAGADHAPARRRRRAGPAARRLRFRLGVARRRAAQWGRSGAGGSRARPRRTFDRPHGGWRVCRARLKESPMSSPIVALRDFTSRAFALAPHVADNVGYPYNACVTVLEIGPHQVGRLVYPVVRRSSAV